MIRDEDFFAWLDGELAPEDAARVEAEVAADPEKSRLAAEHRAMTAGLQRAFGTVASLPVPESLRLAARSDGSDRLVDLVAARASRETRRARPLWLEMASLAATLVIGLFAGSILFGGLTRDEPSPVASKAEQLVAADKLKEALDVRLASMPQGEGPRIGLTFRAKDGAICRTFEDGNASGMACRGNGDWQIRSLFQGSEAEGTDYRMAGGTSRQLMEAVDAAIDGEPFDAARESAARERNWND